LDFSQEGNIKERYLKKAITEYEYSFGPEYDRTRMTAKAATEGTLDFDYHSSDSDVEISRDGAWVNARVWVPKEWLDSE
jgi:hypothetical protein